MNGTTLVYPRHQCPIGRLDCYNIRDAHWSIRMCDDCAEYWVYNYNPFTLDWKYRRVSWYNWLAIYRIRRYKR